MVVLAMKKEVNLFDFLSDKLKFKVKSTLNIPICKYHKFILFVTTQYGNKIISQKSNC